MCQPTAVDGKLVPAPQSEDDAGPLHDHRDADGVAPPPRERTSSLARWTLERGTLLSCLSILLLITGMSITFPHMQSRRDALGCDSLCYGTMTSVRSALGLVGTAAVGRMSDRNGSILARTLGSLGRTAADGEARSSGRRACLYIGTLASLAGLVIAAAMNSLRGLWLSMIPGALLQHNFDVYKALLSEYHNDIDRLEGQTKDGAGMETSGDREDATSIPSRSGSVGKLGMAVGISFMIGPAIAAVVSPSFQSALYFAIVCTVASGVVIFKLPLSLSSIREQTQGVSDDCESKSRECKSEFTMRAMLRPKSPKARAAVFLLVVRLNMALAFHVFNTVWPTSLRARFNFGPTDHARFMSFIGVTYAFSQGFLAKRLVHMWGKEGKIYIIMACCAILGAGRYVAYYTQSLLVMYATFLFIINALGTMNTVITADTGSIAPSNEIGGLFGILQAAESAAGMIGPFLGGIISHYLGADAPLMAVVGVYGFLFAFVSWGYGRYIASSDNTNAKAVKKSM